MDWKRWLTQPKLELWQACALVLEIDPDKLHRLDRAGSKSGPTLTNCRSVFGSAEANEAFNLALEAAAAAASYDGPIKMRDRLSVGMNPKTALVELRDVVAYFADMGRPIPAPLIGLLRPIEVGDQQEFESAFRGTQLNGAPVDWDYWMKMQRLTIQQAAMLMQGFDPDKVSSLEGGPLTEPHRSAREKARKIERLATANHEADRSPTEWVLWAEENGLPVCQEFVTQVNRLNGCGVGQPARHEEPSSAALTISDSGRAQEAPQERQDRRLKRFRELGGKPYPLGDEWRFDRGTRGALAALEREARNADEPMKDKSDIRQDLRKALDRERSGKPQTGE